MNYLTYTSKLQALIYFIEKGWIKTPKDITNKLNVSERTASRLISHLKESDIPLKYCRSRKCYIILK